MLDCYYREGGHNSYQTASNKIMSIRVPIMCRSVVFVHAHPSNDIVLYIIREWVIVQRVGGTLWDSSETNTNVYGVGNTPFPSGMGKANVNMRAVMKKQIMVNPLHFPSSRFMTF